MPSDYVKGNRRPEYFEFTSQRKGFERFHTPEVKQLVDQLETAEDALKEAMVPFLCAIFSRFHEKKEIWTQLVSILAEVDCLASLALVSEGQCRPELLPYEGEYADTSYFEIKGMVHPCVQLQDGRSFIPNDTLIDPSNGQGVLLVTGPNMGGKSTLLRQNCMAAVLAQIGCFVPCTSFKLTPVDRIFTRLGASDRILEGKSTFFVEMEETKNVIQYGTFKSLAILDELGRGTSTFDGYSIAHAVLSHVLNTIRCRTLFSTHYHMLLNDFRDKEGVKSYHMSYKEINDGIMFLYKFEPGECAQSFGINVARLAGIADSILARASLKSKDFSANLDALTKRAQAAKV